jgi:hypothetical protein
MQSNNINSKLSHTVHKSMQSSGSIAVDSENLSNQNYFTSTEIIVSPLGEIKKNTAILQGKKKYVYTADFEFDIYIPKVIAAGDDVILAMYNESIKYTYAEFDMVQNNSLEAFNPELIKNYPAYYTDHTTLSMSDLLNHPNIQETEKLDRNAYY